MSFMRSLKHQITSVPLRPVTACLLPAFFSVWAILRAGQLSTRSMPGPALFLFCAWFFRHVSGLYAPDACPSAPAGQEPRHPSSGCRSVRLRPAAFLPAALFTLFTLAADASLLTAGLENRLFRLIILLACGAGFFFLYRFFLLFVLYYAGPYVLEKEKKPLKRLPLVSFFLCLLFWLPYFLYEFPGVMTPDSINQLEQVLGMAPYSNHHPWTHTMLMGLLYRIGRLFTDDVTVAVSLFTVFQMCFMAAAVSFLIATLVRLGVKNRICMAVAAFYALVPFHGVFAVTLWKDVMFSGAVLFFTTALARLLLLSGEAEGQTQQNAAADADRPCDGPGKRAAVMIIYALSGILFCLFRSNGFYAFLFTLPFLLFSFRRSLKRMLPLTAAILAVVLTVKGPVMTAFQVTQPDFAESICIPLQQVARVICEDRTLKEEEWELVHRVIDTTYIKELYAPGFADNMKELVRAGHPEYLADHKGEYLKLWLTLGLRYPADYVNAYIDQTVGYWYPDVEYTVADIDGVTANDAGVASRPLIGGPLVVKTKEILLKLGGILPLYGLLFSMGAMFWALLVCIAVTAVKGLHRRYLLFLPGLAVILTLFIATPVSNEFRYAYSLMYALPLYVLLPFLPAGKSKAQDS